MMTVALTPGGITGSSIGRTGEIDDFSFVAAPGNIVDLMITSTPTQSGFRATAELFAPNGASIVVFTADSGNIRRTITAGGTYRVRVRDDNFRETGSYTIGLEGIRGPSPFPVTLPKGQIVTGSIDQRIDKDQFIFHANAGDIVDVAVATTSVRQTGYVTLVEVFAPNGQVIAAFTPQTGNRRLTLTTGGTYLVQISDDNYTQTGTYSIGLEGIKSVSWDARTISRGTTVMGTISQWLQKDQFLFTGSTNQVVQISLGSTPLESGFVATAEVFNGNGLRIAMFTVGQPVPPITLPDNGTYMIMISDNDLSQTGRYALTIR